jgi:uncharacterized membrane protein YedE/YeeE
MEHFTPILSTIGGLLIGLSAAIILVANGRIAGISGIFRGVIQPMSGDFKWRAAFIGGLVAGGAVMMLLTPSLFAVTIERSTLAVVAAGLLVGFGTRLGNGCTSGHGVCGLSRFSARSLVATISFMATGAITVYVINHMLGGTL